ncbi:hypothetical protein [Laspinema olomoucense]|uniref:Uncharacterized protein n=1 Tax=Laspinema olomoucense D3b TaxID=2953688 RepID=A0ABT2N7B8_9CYAN|nr:MULTISPECIES: hypothetical protein [unclassified Laspinema]MCT7975039.1 hypothetical protein [Laspinema sp. D3d]MCT7978594.1 hypothetical protein [Laspinema sp. D3b]MCT7987175.1 hypothetical protein [Laspinema sp. D3a]
MANLQDKQGTATAKIPPKSPKEKGISFGVKMWIFFMVAFGVLGYSTTLSILFGVVGGVAAGLIYAWWHITDIPEQTPASEAQKTLLYVAEQRSKIKANSKFKK